MSLIVSSVKRVSVSATGAEGDQASGDARLSSDGHVVAFFSNATTLTPGDTNGTIDLFFRNLDTDTLTLASWNGQRGYGPQFSQGGGTLGFMSIDGGVNHILAANTATGAITEISASASGEAANATSGGFAFSADGARVVFQSNADNLVSGDANGHGDIFIKDLATGSVTLVSTSAAGQQADGDSSGAVFSPDGGKVLFASAATNLADSPYDTDGSITEYFIKDLATGAVTLVPGGALPEAPVFSPDGGKILFTTRTDNLVDGDTDGRQDYFVQDIASGHITLLGGGEGFLQPPQFSPLGGYVIFSTPAATLVPGDTNNATDVFIQNIDTGAITRLSTDSGDAQGSGASQKPVFSADETKVAFTSLAPEFATGDADAVADFYVKDLTTGVLTRIAIASSAALVFSPDGSKLFFGSAEDNLVAGDADGAVDYFIRDLVTGETLKVIDGDHVSGFPAMAADWSRIVFVSDAGDLVDGDTNGVQDVFVVTLGEDDEESNILTGTEGNDRLESSGTGKIYYGLGGDDVLINNDAVLPPSAFGDTERHVNYAEMHGGAGNDTLFANGLLFGDAGNDTITVRGGASGASMAGTVDGGTGNDKIIGAEGDDTLSGGDGNDRVYGGDGNDTLKGGSGIDTLNGDAGDDKIYGGSGLDILRGGDGNDTMYGESDADALYGGKGNDRIDGGTGSDLIYGDSGDDLLLGGGGSSSDAIRGGTGNDTIYGYGGADDLRGNEGHDTLYGGDGNDFMLGDSGSNTPGSGNDTLYGEKGNDTLRGGLGNDRLNGGAGTDTLYGEGGADTFAFDASTAGSVDNVKDFKLSQGDRLDVSGLLTDFDPLTDAITKFVKITASGTSSFLYVDRDGADTAYGFQKIAVLESTHGLNVQSLFDHAQLIA